MIMLVDWIIILSSFGYLLVLFAIAYVADKRAERGAGITSHPYIYALSLGVYCTSWISSAGGRSQSVLTRSWRVIASRGGLMSLATAVAFALAMLVPVRHRESCDVRIEPSMRRFVSAPFDATLRDCVVGPGRSCAAG